MVIRFFAYNKATGGVFVFLPDMPDNDDYMSTGEIQHQGKIVASGIKWSNAGVWANQDGVDIDPTHEYVYHADTNTLEDRGVVNG